MSDSLTTKLNHRSRKYLRDSVIFSFFYITFRYFHEKTHNLFTLNLFSGATKEIQFSTYLFIGLYEEKLSI